MHTDIQPQKNNTVKDCFLLLILTAFIYLPFLGLPAWDGNEPLRVIIARDMLKTGDWIIPMLHGKPYFTKPPMMNWLIAGSGSLLGVVNEWTSRIPSVCIVFATAMSIYFLTRKWLSQEGRLFASMAAVCMIGLIKKGRTAEIDTLFIFFVVFILLAWLNGYVRQWKPVLLWSITLSLVGLGFLAKGPQVIAYFYLTIFAYLLFRKRMSFFFSKEHLFGLLCFVLVLGVYMFFVMQRITLERYTHMWIYQIVDRAESKTSLSFIEHLILYPLEGILSFMPWMLMTIPVVISRELRRQTRAFLSNELFVFSLVMIIVNFPLYWVLPNARFRYFLPAGPFVAIGIAFLFEMYLNEVKENPAIDRFVKSILVFCAVTALISSIGFITAVFILNPRSSGSFTLYLLILLCSIILLGVYILHTKQDISLRQMPIWIAFATGLLFITYAYIDSQFNASREHNARAIAKKISSALPDDVGRIYELGYRRFLGITCYLNKDIIQEDEFSDLKSLETSGDKVFFLFDTKYLDAKELRKKALKEIAWDRVYSEFFENSRGEIVLGRLKKTQTGSIIEHGTGSNVLLPTALSP
jgi:4-amino-4-deoxy-L-arabinose transferase-like glycosyltransferase